MEEQIYFGEKIYYYELKLSQIRDLHYKINLRDIRYLEKTIKLFIIKEK